MFSSQQIVLKSKTVSNPEQTAAKNPVCCVCWVLVAAQLWKHVFCRMSRVCGEDKLKKSSRDKREKRRVELHRFFKLKLLSHVLYQEINQRRFVFSQKTNTIILWNQSVNFQCQCCWCGHRGWMTEHSSGSWTCFSSRCSHWKSRTRFLLLLLLFTNMSVT